MDHGNVIISFDSVTFGYDDKKLLLEEASFSVRERAKITIMGQNGAGKSTIFKLITGELKPNEGSVNTGINNTIAVSHQVMKEENLEKTVEEFFTTAFAPKSDAANGAEAGGSTEAGSKKARKSQPSLPAGRHGAGEEKKLYNLPGKIKKILEVVHLPAPLDKKIKQFSGGQQARLLLAHALIQEPDILLLDEPTNNLDADGIMHLTQFLIDYPKTCLVISHDANFLNAFTHGVLYLDSFIHKVEQYLGDYYDALGQIEAQVERERAKNAQLRKSILDRKEKINFFANKGGKMRKLASKLRDQVEEAEDEMVDERQEDKTINHFSIPAQEGLVGAVAEIASVGIMVNHEPVHKTLRVPLLLRKNQKLAIEGPNGIGKSTLLKALAEGSEPGATITKGVTVGYYRQDFSGLDFSKTGYDALAEMIVNPISQEIYATGAQFLLYPHILRNKIGSYSEGQKGLLCYARFVLQKPGLLIMDEPTNHINFRHLPVIAQALNDYKGAMILVSHAYEFMAEIKIDETLDLGELR
jgi:ATP-binding cassette subfamily F protein 3